MSKAIKKKATIFYNKVVRLPTTIYKRHMPIHAEVEIKIVSQISLMSHSSGFALLKIKLRSNLNIYTLYGPRGQPAQVDKNTDFSTRILFLFLVFFSIDCQTGYGDRQPFDLTHYGHFIIITNYVQNNESVLVPRPISHSQKYFLTNVYQAK